MFSPPLTRTFAYVPPAVVTAMTDACDSLLWTLRNELAF
jgi:hypothetical protein